MKITTVKLFLLLAFFFTAAVYAQTPTRKVRIAPGALCYAWHENTFSKPDSVPAGGFVDESSVFMAENIHKCEELRNIKREAFIMWEGYLRIPRSGQYRFTLLMNENNWASRKGTSVKVFLNNHQLMTRVAGREMTLSSLAELKGGFIRVRVYCNVISNLDSSGFKLKFAPVAAMKMSSITPGKLYHPVEYAK